MKPLVIIPARGGSKGVPRKNIKLLGDKPLIYWTIYEARKVFKDENICVSTDDLEIKQIVEKTGLKVPFLRPQELATDTASTQDALLHAVDFYEKNYYHPDCVILLQPTSPFRKAENIENALALYTNDIDMVVSVNKTESNPYYNLKEENKDGFLETSKKANFTRRQDCPPIFEVNGAVYIININSLKAKKMNDFELVRKSLMSFKDSLDIDTESDFKFAEYLLKNK